MSNVSFVDKEGFTSFWKDKDSVADYDIDWSRWLGTDTISTSTWTGNGITVDSSSNTTTTTTVWLSTNSGVSEAKNSIVTAAGLKADRTLRFYERVR